MQLVTITDKKYGIDIKRELFDDCNIIDTAFINDSGNINITHLRKTLSRAYAGRKRAFTESDTTHMRVCTKRRIKSNDVRISYSCSYFFYRRIEIFCMNGIIQSAIYGNI